MKIDKRGAKWDVVLGRKLWDDEDLKIEEIAARLSSPEMTVRVAAVKRYAYAHGWRPRSGYLERVTVPLPQQIAARNEIRATRRCPECRGHIKPNVAHVCAERPATRLGRFEWAA